MRNVNLAFWEVYFICFLLLLLLLLNVFDDAPVCRHVKDESWARAVTWRTTEMQVSKDEYVMTV